MDAFVWETLRKTGMDEEALRTLQLAEKAVCADPEWNAGLAVPLAQIEQENWPSVREKLCALAERCGQPPYTLHLLHLARNLPAMHDACVQRGIPDSIFVDSASDLNTKLAECRVHFGVCGTASYQWQIKFFHLRLITLGRLTYETRPYTGPEYNGHGFSLREGDSLLGLHIPSGSFFGRETRMDSYRRAYAFYGCTKEKPLIVHCNSWLLNPDHREMLSPSSNIIDFMNDFDIVSDWERPEFPDAWRVFGRAADGPRESWPADNSLRRGYLKLLAEGKSPKNGHGILIFDGEKLLTGQHRN